MELKKIVITGGPSGGKTTGLSWIRNEFTRLGYTVLIVPETATELISGGVAPWTCGTNLEYQKIQMKLQLEKEELFERAARTMNTDKVLLVCDRGAMDNKAYMTPDEFDEVLDEVGRSEVELRDGYDAVFHLETAAKGTGEHYTTANNAARYETAEQALATDHRLIASWTGHPHLRVIENSDDFEDKMKRLISEIRIVLGEPEALEIERKFLIEYPDLAMMESLPHCRKVEIQQVYLLSQPGEELRIRRRGENGSYIYYRTSKHRLSDSKRLEVEKHLSQNEYRKLMRQADPSKRPLDKTRYCLMWEGQYLEVDVYPFWNDKATVEVELSDESAPVHLPPWMKVIREVTDDPAFSNAALAGK